MEKRTFGCKLFLGLVVVLWFTLFAINTTITFIIYAVLRLFFLKRIANAWMWANARFLSKSITYMLGAKVEVKGKENLPKTEGHYCIVGNHESYLDITNILGFCRLETGFVAKNSLKWVPFLNLWMLAFRCVFIKRGGVRSSIAAINDAVEHIKKGVKMVIFPEGHRSKIDDVEEFKHGSLKLALRSNATIIPIAMKGSRANFEGRKKVKPFVKITISVLPLIDTTTLSKEEKDALALRLETDIRNERNKYSLEIEK